MSQTNFQIAGAFQGFLNNYTDPTTSQPLTPEEKYNALKEALVIAADEAGKPVTITE